MNLLLDMNLSPTWTLLLETAGHSVKHWSQIGAPGATDSEILQWARQQRYVLFTHDLDFGAILASSNADAPSVIQLRTQNPIPDHSGQCILSVLSCYAEALESGALITVDEDQSRIRLLPIRNES